MMLKLWQRYLTHHWDIATHAPQVITHRLTQMAHKPAASKTLVESQRMVWEKWAAANESWLAFWTSMHKSARWPVPGHPMRPMSPAKVHAQAQRAAVQTLRAAGLALHPVSRRVKANSKRLGGPGTKKR
jgi:hypothetical protein